MSGTYKITVSEARAAAYWLEAQDLPNTAVRFRKEAERLENAAKTPGQVAWDSWCEDRGPEKSLARMDRVASAVIAHVVGPDRAVVEVALLAEYRPSMDAEVLHSWAKDVLHRARTLS